MKVKGVSIAIKCQLYELLVRIHSLHFVARVLVNKYQMTIEIY